MNTPSPSHPQPAVTASLLVVTILIWASSFVAIRAGLTGFSPGELGAARFALVAGPAALVLVLVRPALPDRADMARLVAGGVLFVALYTLLLNYGQQTVSAGPAAFIINTNPMMTAALSVWLLGERFGWRAWTGTVVSLAGVALIAAGQDSQMRIDTGALLILGAALCNAITAVVQKPLFARYHPVVVASWNIVIGSICLVPWLPGALVQAGEAPREALIGVVYLALLPSLVAYATWAALLARMPASRAANFMYCVPPVTLAMAAVVLGEFPSPLSVTGGVVALAGVLMVQIARRPAPAAAGPVGHAPAPDSPGR